MTLLLLEALAALLILIFIVWWTMFSGRKKGELPADAEREKAQMVQDQETTRAAATGDGPGQAKPDGETAPRN